MHKELFFGTHADNFNQALAVEKECYYRGIPVVERREIESVLNSRKNKETYTLAIIEARVVEGKVKVEITLE